MGAFALAFGAQAFYMGREWEEDELKSKKLVQASRLHFGKLVAELSVFSELKMHPQRGGHVPQHGLQTYSMWVLLLHNWHTS